MTTSLTTWVDEMLKALAISDVAGAQLAKDPHIPARLYRYRGCSSYSVDNLRSDTTWMTATNEYNGPFDSAMSFPQKELLGRTAERHGFRLGERLADTFSWLDDEQRTKLRASDDALRLALDYAVRGGHITREHRDFFDAGLAEIFAENRDPILRAISERSQQAVYACSFSEAFDSVLMWSHYAAAHTGFCVEYDFAMLPPDHQKRIMMFPVIYGDQLFDATDFIHKDPEKINPLVGALAALHKSSDWSYEREWRLLAPGMDEGKGFNTSMPRPSALYLGARISESDEATVTKVAQELLIPIKKMHPSLTEYRVVPT